MLALLCTAISFTGCQTTAENGMFGSNGYLQLFIGDVIVFEYAVPGGGMNCQKNAFFNNREIDPPSNAEYRCARQPASTKELPYSFVSISTLGTFQGYRASNASTSRFATREACWEAVMDLEKDSQKLISESCGLNESPDPVRPGENKA
jgi:hypothetical protein